MIKALYERGLIDPDLLKFQNIPQRKDGKLVFQLQEIEEEETFVDWVKLFRVVHPKNSEVIPDSEFKKFYVFDKKDVEQKIVLSARANLNNSFNIVSHFQKIKHLWAGSRESKDKLFQPNDQLELTFLGLKKDGVPLLLVKSMFRDWMMGEEHYRNTNFTKSFFDSPVVVQSTMLLFGAFLLLLQRKSLGSAFALMPFVMGSACGCDGSDCGGGPGACGSDQCKSLLFSYRDEAGHFQRVSIHEPRDWRHGTEIIKFPHEAISANGTMTVRIDFTKRHKLSFAGVLQDFKKIPYRTEVLEVKRATHSRMGEITQSLNEMRKMEYGHMIPGDTIDVEFENPNPHVKTNERETYLMQSSGFYTELRRQSKRLAGDWFSKISDEAKSHYQELTSLRSC